MDPGNVFVIPPPEGEEAPANPSYEELVGSLHLLPHEVGKALFESSKATPWGQVLAPTELARADTVATMAHAKELVGRYADSLTPMYFLIVENGHLRVLYGWRTCRLLDHVWVIHGLGWCPAGNIGAIPENFHPQLNGLLDFMRLATLSRDDSSALSGAWNRADMADTPELESWHLALCDGYALHYNPLRALPHAAAAIRPAPLDKGGDPTPTKSKEPYKRAYTQMTW